VYTLLVILLVTVGIYLVIGLIFYVALSIKGFDKIDPGTRNSGIGFKLILVPGILVFWPILWKKWKAN